MPVILGIPMFSGTIEDAVNLIINDCVNGRAKKANLVSATSAHGLVLAQKDLNFASILRSFYINLPDGMPSVWVGRLKGDKNMKRCSGTDFFKEVMLKTKNLKINHFLCGGKEGVPEKLKKVCEEKFENKNVVGVYSPPFREMTEDEIKSFADEINSLDINILWIGLSTPKQEIFAYRLSKYVNVNFICTVGAAFDFWTGNVKRAPKWIQNIGMEWFFRLMMEPKRLWKRYAYVVPMFIFYNFLEIFNGSFLKQKLDKNL